MYPTQPPDSDLEALTDEIAGYVRDRSLPVAVSLRVDPIWLRLYLVDRYLTTLGLDADDPSRDADVDEIAFTSLPDPAGDFIEDGLAFELTAEMQRWYRWCDRMRRRPTPMQCEVQVYLDSAPPPERSGHRPDYGRTEPGSDRRAALAREIREQYGREQPLRIVVRGQLPRQQGCPKGQAVGPERGAAYPGTLGGLVHYRGDWAATTVAHVMHPTLVGPVTMSSEQTVADETTLLTADPAHVAVGVPVRIGRSGEVENGHLLRMHGLATGHSAGTVVGRYASFPLQSARFLPDGRRDGTTVDYGRCYQLQDIRRSIFGIKRRPISRGGDSGAWMMAAIGGELSWVGTLVGGDDSQSAATYVEAFPPVTSGEIDAAMVIPDCTP